MVGRELAADVLELLGRRAEGLAAQGHACLLQRLRTLVEVAVPAGRDDVLPGGASAPRSGHHVVECQMVAIAAVLAGELVTQEQVEAGEGGGPRGLHVFLEHDDRGDPERDRGRVDKRVVLGNHHDPFEHGGLHRLLPRPERQRQVGERPEVGVEHEGRVVAQPARVPDEAGHVRALQHQEFPCASHSGAAPPGRRCGSTSGRLHLAHIAWQPSR
jgi:hypothetical protein